MFWGEGSGKATRLCACPLLHFWALQLPACHSCFSWAHSRVKLESKCHRPLRLGSLLSQTHMLAHAGLREVGNILADEVPPSRTAATAFSHVPPKVRWSCVLSLLRRACLSLECSSLNNFTISEKWWFYKLSRIFFPVMVRPMFSWGFHHSK